VQGLECFSGELNVEKVKKIGISEWDNLEWIKRPVMRTSRASSAMDLRL